MNNLVKVILIVIGSISVLLGVIGIFLPLLPTTPFMLLAATCYMKSSKRLYNRLINNKYFGKYIKDYQEGKGIPLKAKILAIATLWPTILYSFFFLIEKKIPKYILLIIGISVTIHLLRIKTSSVNNKEIQQNN